MMPIKEMTDVLRVTKQAQLKLNQWVRLNHGIYKDDLAQVDFVSLSQNYVHLKLIPRVDYTEKRGALRSNISDDEDDTHPNIDTPSLFRWRHQARVERMAEFQHEKDECEKLFSEAERKVQDVKEKIKYAESNKDLNMEELTKELDKLMNEEKKLKEKKEELLKKEKVMPWNVDTISKEGFTKTEPEKCKKGKKPPAKMFDVHAIRALGGEVGIDGDFWIFEGNRYSRRGFLFKSFAKSALIVDGVKPTLSELENFSEE